MNTSYNNIVSVDILTLPIKIKKLMENQNIIQNAIYGVLFYLNLIKIFIG